jgi:NAD(P)H-dependent flavin oxidoreductase YrpB (nitropropane dioxygenase family)
VDGFIIEGPTAGGHNAPPRGQLQLNERGEPIYGPRDEADHARLRDLGLPFWLAGGTGSPEGLQQALAVGAAGIQVGTIFAYSSDSGMASPFRKSIVRRSKYAPVDVYTDPLASPTGFPFKVVDLEGSLSHADVARARTRVCDLGYLRTAFKREDGRVDYRCPAEPIDTYLKKGGAIEETVGRKCLCNALMADIGMGQVREKGDVERPLITSGDELRSLNVILAGRDDYSAADVLDYLLAGVTAAASA